MCLSHRNENSYQPVTWKENSSVLLDWTAVYSILNIKYRVIVMLLFHRLKLLLLQFSNAAGMVVAGTFGTALNCGVYHLRDSQRSTPHNIVEATASLIQSKAKQSKVCLAKAQAVASMPWNFNYT